MIVGYAARVPRPENSADAAAKKIDKAHRIHVGNRRGAGNLYGIAPGIAALIDPQDDLTVGNVDDIGKTIAVHIAHQNPFRVIAEGKAGRTLHVQPFGPLAVALIRPIDSAAVVNHCDVLQAVLLEKSPHLTRGSEKLTFGKSSRGPRLAQYACL